MWDLVSREEVQSIYKIDKEDLEDTWYDFSESLLLQHLGKETLTDVTEISSFSETLSGNSGKVILLSNKVNSLTSITVLYASSVELAGTYQIAVGDLSFYGKELVYDSGVFPEGVRNITVVYDARIANDTVYKFTMATMIAAIANYEGRKGSDRSIKWGDLPMEFGDESANESIGLVSHLKAILHQTIPMKERGKIR